MFSLGSSFSICFFRQKATVVFHSLKDRVFLCGDEGEGTEAFLVNNDLVWFDFCFTALRHILGHFERGQLT